MKINDLITTHDRRILREHRGSTVEARAIHDRLREHGFAFCRGCARIQRIATAFYKTTARYESPHGHSNRCKRCSRKADRIAAAPYVMPDAATTRARRCRNTMRSVLIGARHAGVKPKRSMRLDVPVKVYNKDAA